MITRALSLRQPWGSLMTAGIKRIENRSWRTAYRGPVLVHASSWWGAAEAEDDYDTARRIMDHAGLGPMPLTLAEMKAARGGIIGAFTVTDCISRSDDPFFFGPYGFTVEDAASFPAVVPCRGSLGFFSVPADVSEACQRFLEIAR